MKLIVLIIPTIQSEKPQGMNEVDFKKDAKFQKYFQDQPSEGDENRISVEDFGIKCNYTKPRCFGDYKLHCFNKLEQGTKCATNKTCVSTRYDVKCVPFEEKLDDKCDQEIVACNNNKIIQCNKNGTVIVRDCTKEKEYCTIQSNSTSSTPHDVKCSKKKPECDFVGLKCTDGKLTRCLNERLSEDECDEGQVCSYVKGEVACVKKCEFSGIRCSGDQFTTCSNGIEQTDDCGSVAKCGKLGDQDTCINKCTAEGYKANCVKGKLITCKDGWEFSEDCGDEVCKNGFNGGKCVPKCKDGDQCSNNHVVKCVEGLIEKEKCQDGLMCSLTGDRARCSKKCPYEGTKCNNGKIMKCNQNMEIEVSKCKCGQDLDHAYCQEKCKKSEISCLTSNSLLDCKNKEFGLITKCPVGSMCKAMHGDASCSAECPFKGQKCKDGNVIECNDKTEIIEKCSNEHTCQEGDGEAGCVKKCKYKGSKCNSISTISTCNNGTETIRKCKKGQCQITPNSAKCPEDCPFAGSKCKNGKLISCQGAIENPQDCKEGEECNEHNGEAQCTAKCTKNGSTCTKEGQMALCSEGNLFIQECVTGRCVPSKDGVTGKCPGACPFDGYKCAKNNIVHCEDGVENTRACNSDQQCMIHEGKGYCGNSCIYKGKKCDKDTVKLCKHGSELLFQCPNDGECLEQGEDVQCFQKCPFEKCKQNKIVGCTNGQQTTVKDCGEKECSSVDGKIDCYQKCESGAKCTVDGKLETCSNGLLITKPCENGSKCETTEQGFGFCPSTCPFVGSKCYGAKKVAHCQEASEIITKCNADQTCGKNTKGVENCYEKCYFEGSKCRGSKVVTCINGIEEPSDCGENRCKTLEGNKTTCVERKTCSFKGIKCDKMDKVTCNEDKEYLLESCDGECKCKSSANIKRAYTEHWCDFQSSKCQNNTVVVCENHKKVVKKLCKYGCMEIRTHDKDKAVCNKCEPGMLKCIDNHIHACTEDGRLITTSCDDHHRCIIKGGFAKCIDKPCDPKHNKCIGKFMVKCILGKFEHKKCNKCIMSRNGPRCA